MGALECRDDSFQRCQLHERFERLIICCISILDTFLVAQPCVLWTDSGVVQPCRNAVRKLDLAKLILQKIGAGALQNAERTALKTRRMFARANAFPAGS